MYYVTKNFIFNKTLLYQQVLPTIQPELLINIIKNEYNIKMYSFKQNIKYSYGLTCHEFDIYFSSKK